MTYWPLVQEVCFSAMLIAATCVVVAGCAWAVTMIMRGMRNE